MPRKRIPLTIICMIYSMVFLETSSRMCGSVSNSLKKIESTLTAVGKNSQADVVRITIWLRHRSGLTKSNAISSSIEEIGNSINTFMKSDALSITSSAIDIMAGISKVIRFNGSIIRVFCSLFSTILGSIGNAFRDNIGSLVKKAIDEALGSYHDSDLTAAAEETERIYRISQTYLNTEGRTTVFRKRDLYTLSRKIPIYSGVRILSILANKTHESAKIKNFNNGKKAMVYANLYAKLAVLRSVLLTQLQTLIKSRGHSRFLANAVKGMSDDTDKKDKNFIKFLTSPTYDKAYMFVQMTPSKEPFLSKYLRKYGLQFQNLNHLTSGTHTFRPLKWVNRYMIMGSSSKGWMQGSYSLGTEGKFYIDAVNAEDNLFYFRPMKWPEWYVYMNNDSKGYCRGLKGKPGSAGEWKFIQFEDGKFMFSPKKWPNWFVFMVDNNAGSIRGWNGDPGIQGHWLIN